MIVLYVGKNGTGKSFCMHKRLYRLWTKGYDTYSRTKLLFRKHKRIMMRNPEGKKYFEYELDPKYKDKKSSGKIAYFQSLADVVEITFGNVVMDEAQVEINSRNWENLPDEFQYKLQQHRKHSINLFATTQNIKRVDVVFRELVQELINCKCIFQIGQSPRIIFGLFIWQKKDVDEWIDGMDIKDLPTLKWRPYFIHYWSKPLYDTMYDIGFKKFKCLIVSEYNREMKNKRKYLIIPKKMSLTSALRDIRSYRSLSDPRILAGLRKS